MHRLHRYVSLLTFSVWWGGLTFYSAIVVPVGSDIFGSTEQGFVTQVVTHWLNGILGAALLLTAGHSLVSRHVPQLITWCTLLLSLLVLIGLHVRLDGMLDSSMQTVLDSEHFYSMHRIYLWTIAIQWLAGLVSLWYLLNPRKAVVKHEATK